MREVLSVAATVLLTACAVGPGASSPTDAAGSPDASRHTTPAASPLTSPTASPGSSAPAATSSPTSATTPIGAPIATDPATIAERYQDALALFEYDATQPLDVEVAEAPIAKRDFGARYAISYASPRGDRVSGTIGIPAGDGPFPAVIVMHGMPGQSSDLAQLVGDYPAAGVIALAIDAPFVRSGRMRDPAQSIRDPENTRDDQIQLIRDLRRAVDVLAARPDVAGDRIGYQGFSYGGAVGGLLAGVEPRIGAFVLAVGDGGLVEHLHDPADYEATLGSLSQAERDAWIAAMEPIEPIYFIGHTTADVYFQSARHDEFIPVDAAERLHAAGPEGSKVDWYESGHFLPSEAFCSASAWLDQQLDFEGTLHGCD